MKILYIGPSVYDLKGLQLPEDKLLGLGIKRGNFFNSSCFGYDTIVIDPKSLSVLLNRTNVVNAIDYSLAFGFRSKIIQWSKELSDWISRGGNLYVVLQPVRSAWGKAFDDSFVSISNYDFLPINIPGEIKGSSGERYIGETVTSNSSMRELLDKDTFFVNAYLENKSDAKIEINSMLIDNRATSFSVDFGNGKIVFMPEPSSALYVFNYLRNLYSTNFIWKTTEQKAIESDIEKIDHKIDKLDKDKENLKSKLNILLVKVQTIVGSDVFYTKASKKFQAIKLSKNPDPREIYDVLETLESAFISQTEMRDKLHLTKSECGALTRRCNEFRHDQKGIEPKPLTNKELKSFMDLLEKAIENYLQYIYTKFSKETT